MGLSGRVEVGVDAQMDLEIVSFEPATAASGEMRRLCHLWEAEQSVVEADGVLLASCRHGQLHVIDAADFHGVSLAAPSSGHLALVPFAPLVQTCAVARWPVSAQDARDMYASGHGDETARWYARNWSRVFRTGLLPRRWVTLEVRGRVSGRSTSYPLGMADVDGRWFLVSMLGECNWVKNVRAAGGHVVIRRRRPRRVRLTEVPFDGRAAVLRRYVAKVPGGRPHIPVAPGSPLAEFESIAESYPVFEVTDE